MKKVIKVRYIKNDKYAYECEDPEIKVNSFVWCKVREPKTGKEYEQLAIVTDECTEEEAEIIRSQLEAKGKKLKAARKFTKENKKG